MSGRAAGGSALERMLDPATIRSRCAELLGLGLEGRLEHFAIDEAALPAIADRVAAETRARYPSLDIPYHGRWGHLRAGGRDRVAEVEAAIAQLDAAERGRRHVELVLTSVLLDAGAGPDWRFVESGTTYARSEGLAVASHHAFVSGLFSADPADPLRADARALARIDAAALGRAFQVGPDNPLVGLEGRAALLRRLGEVVLADRARFGASERLGGLFDHLAARAEDGRLPAPGLLHALLVGLGPIWPGRLELDGAPLGDVWRHPAAAPAETDGTRQLVPFHKLSQWLAYSLLEPLGRAGIEVTALDRLTGLAEYRNGGLFVDAGALVPKHAAVRAEPHAPGSEVVVEWRALTVALLDRLAPLVRARLDLDASTFPLAKMLEGGTWHAGRALAREARPGGAPPLTIESDGTVF